MSERYIETLEARETALDPNLQQAKDMESSVVQERTDAVKTKATELRQGQKLFLDRPDQIFWDRVAADGVDISEGVDANYLGDAHPERYLGGRDITNGFQHQPDPASDNPEWWEKLVDEEDVGQLEERRLNELSFAEGLVPWLMAGAMVGVRNAVHNSATLAAPYVHTPDKEQLLEWGLTQEEWDVKDVEQKRSVYSLKIANSLEQFTNLSEATSDTGTAQGFVQTIGQYAVPAIGVARAVKALGVTSTFLADLVGGVSTAPFVAERGEETIANVAIEFGLADENGFVAEYLASKPDDTTLEAMAKQAVTDGLANAAGVGLFSALGKGTKVGAGEIMALLGKVKGTPKGKFIAEQVTSQRWLARAAKRGEFKAGALIDDVDIEKHYANLMTNDILEGKLLKQQFMVDGEKYFAVEKLDEIWKAASTRAKKFAKMDGFEAMARGPRVPSPLSTPSTETTFRWRDGGFHMSTKKVEVVGDPLIAKAAEQADNPLQIKKVAKTPEELLEAGQGKSLFDRKIRKTKFDNLELEFEEEYVIRKGGEKFEGTEFAIADPSDSDRPFGFVSVSLRGDSIFIDDITAFRGPLDPTKRKGVLGPTFVNRVKILLEQKYPSQKFFEGERVSGTRQKGKYVSVKDAIMAKIKSGAGF